MGRNPAHKVHVLRAAAQPGQSLLASVSQALRPGPDLRAELVNYFSPQGPLENLQIDRIAQLQAQLVLLAQSEEAARQLARQRSQVPSRQVLAELDPAATDLTLALGLAWLEGRQPPPPYGLSDQVLAELAPEVSERVRLVTNVDDLNNLLPKTSAHLQSPAFDAISPDLGGRLHALAQALKPLPEPSLDDSPAQVIDRILMQINASAVSVSDAAHPSSATKLQNDLLAIVAEQHWRQQVQLLVQRYRAALPIYLQSALPPLDQANALHRQQIGLQRQLSRSIDELLKMITRRTRG